MGTSRLYIIKFYSTSYTYWPILFTSIQILVVMTTRGYYSSLYHQIYSTRSTHKTHHQVIHPCNAVTSNRTAFYRFPASVWVRVVYLFFFVYSTLINAYAYYECYFVLILLLFKFAKCVYSLKNDLANIIRIYNLSF